MATMAQICADVASSSSSSAPRANSTPQQQQQQQTGRGAASGAQERRDMANNRRENNTRAAGEDAKGAEVRAAATPAASAAGAAGSRLRDKQADSAASADGATAEAEEEEENEGKKEGHKGDQQEEEEEEEKVEAKERSTSSSSSSKRRKLLELRRSRLKKVSPHYVSNSSEYYFLQTKSADAMDFPRDFSAFRKRPPAKFLNFLQTKRPKCPPSVLEEMREVVGPPSPSSSSSSSSSPAPPAAPGRPGDVLGPSSTLAERLASPVAPARPMVPAITYQQQQQPPSSSSSPLRQQDGQVLPGLGSQKGLSQQAQRSSQQSSPSAPAPPAPTPTPHCAEGASPSAAATRALALPTWLGANSARVPSRTRELLADRMKQEAWVLRRVHELSKEGVWTPRRLPKVCERPRARTQWDFLLQETQWLSVDFYQERQWKRAAAKALAHAAKEFVERWEETKARAKEAEERRRRKLASFVAGEVRSFWEEVGTLAEARHRIPAGVLVQVANHNNVSVKQQQQQQQQTNHPDKKPTSPQVRTSENGILIDGESDESEEFMSDQESTISEQERFEEEEGKGGLDAILLKELKDLAYETTLPIETLLPEDYPQTLSEAFVSSSEGEEEEEEEEGDKESDHSDEAEEEEEDPQKEEGNQESETSSIVDLSEMSIGSLDQLVSESCLARKARESTVRVRMGVGQRRMYDDYLAGPSARAALEKGEVAGVTRVIEDLRRICNHPRLSSDAADDDCGSGSVCGAASFINIPRVADHVHFHRLFRTALSYNPWQHFDLVRRVMYRHFMYCARN